MRSKGEHIGMVEAPTARELKLWPSSSLPWTAIRAGLVRKIV